MLFSQNYACEDCGISIEELTPRDVLLQQPLRRLPDLRGPGHASCGWTPALHHPEPGRSPCSEGGLQASGWGNVKGDSIAKMYFDALAKKYRLQAHDARSRTCPRRRMDVILYGTERREARAALRARARGTGTLSQPFEGIVNDPRAALPRDAEPVHARGVSRSTWASTPARTAAASA